MIKFKQLGFLTFCAIGLVVQPISAAVDLSDVVQQERDRNLERAAELLKQKLRSADPNSTSDQLLLNAWLAVVYKTLQDPNYIAAASIRSETLDPITIALPYVDRVLCLAHAVEYRGLQNCEQLTIENAPTLSAFELDLVASALAIKGSYYWQQEDFASAFPWYTAAIQIQLRAQNSAVHPEPVVNAMGAGIDYQKIQSLQEMLNIFEEEGRKVQEEMQKNLLSNLSFTDGKIDMKSNPAIMSMASMGMKKMMVEQVIKSGCDGNQNMMTMMLSSPDIKTQLGGDAEQFVARLTELATAEGKSSCQSLQLTKSRPNTRLSNREQSAFYNLAKLNVCNTNLYHQHDALSHSQTILNSLSGNALNANRGNQLTLAKVGREDTLKLFNNYLDQAEKISVDGRVSKQENDFVEWLVKCGTQYQFGNRLAMAIQSSMARGNETLEYYQLAFETGIRDLNRKRDSSTEPTTFLIANQRQYANLLFKKGEVERARSLFQEAMEAIRSSEVSLQNQNLLRWTKAIGDYIEFMKATSGDTATVEQYLRLTIDKQQRYAATLAIDKNLSSTEQKSKDIDNLLLGVDLPIPKEVLEQMSGGSLAEQIEKLNIPAMANTSFDVMGTYAENIRTRTNAIRQFELGVAEVYLKLGNTALAKQWITGKEGRGFEPGFDQRYFTKTLAFDAYVKARYYQHEGDNNKASAEYAKAVDFWYFNPPRELDVILESMFDSHHELLELALEFELDNGDQENAFHYMEVARQARVGSPILYGAYDEDTLAKFQIQIQELYDATIALAAIEAEKQNQTAEFTDAKLKGQRQVNTSVRGYVNPIAPKLTGLDPLLSWIPESDLNQFMTLYERFASLWILRHQQTISNELLAAERNAQSEKIASNSPEQSTIDFSGLDNLLSRSSSNDVGIAVAAVFPQKKNEGGASVIGLEAVKDSLPGDTSVLSYWLTENTVNLLAINRDRSELLAFTTESVKDEVKNLKINYTKASAESLFDKLVSPVKSMLKEKVVIIANGSLQNLPFAALVDKSSGQFMGDTYALRSSPHIASIFNSQRPKTNATFLVLAPAKVAGNAPLPAAEIEAAMLKDNYAAKVYLNDQVTKSLTLEALQDSRIFHFSGHASLDEKLPDFSHLALAKDKYNQAALFVQDIRGLSLTNLDLVVLSACESGSVTDFNTNTEFSALNAAFMEAGARSVVASHHAVGDAVTLALMEKFYQGLEKGLEKDVALQQAQQHIRNTHPDPRDWAAFTLSGNPAPIALR